MINALNPDHMTADECLDEVAEILAAGVMRLIKRHLDSNSNGLRDISLDFNANQSMHGQNINDHGENK